MATLTQYLAPSPMSSLNTTSRELVGRLEQLLSRLESVVDMLDGSTLGSCVREEKPSPYGVRPTIDQALNLIGTIEPLVSQLEISAGIPQNFGVER